MWYDINRFHILAFITWQFANYFAGQNIFGIYANYVPKWRCGNSELTDNCQVYFSCPKRNLTFDAYPFYSTALEFDWICGSNAFYRTFFLQIQFAGLLVGTLLFGSLSDQYGRRPIGIYATAGGMGTSILSSLAPSANALFIVRFFVGLTLGGMLVVLCAWIMEVILPQQRMVLRGLFNWGWTRIALTTVCYFTQHWRLSCFVTGCTLVPALFLVLKVIPESPVWLHSKGKYDEMVASEKKIARIAGIPYVPIHHSSIQPKGLLETLKTKGMLNKLLVLWSMWLIVAICGGAIDLNSGTLAGNLYLNQLLFGILLVFSKMLLLFVDTFCPNFKRRTLHQGSLLGVLLCIGVLTGFTMENYHGIGVLITYLLGTAFIEYTWDACYLCAVELVETPSRACATGTCSLVARIGMIIAPMLLHANTFWPFAVNAIVTILGTISLMISYFFLTESKGVNLDDVRMDETENIPEAEELMMEVQKVREDNLT
ncbi:unnamed protein product [Caenorhabditis brenneri]